ncbi:MAG TPA: membrane dipeptidase [Dongiaceae bacterium]
MTGIEISERARKLYAEALVWDDHSGFDPDPKVDLHHLGQWKRAGVNYLSVNIGYDVVPWRKSLSTIAAFRAWVQQHPDEYVMVETVDDIARAKREGKLAVTFDLEGMNALDGDANMVGAYYALGVRHMLFAYNMNNLAGGGCHDDDQGLTDFGRAVIREMNRVGMVVDCSHTGYRTTMEAMEASQAPVIFSHSCSKAVWKHGRNITDDQIKACAKTGGVIGINGLGIFLGKNDISSENFVNHVTHTAEVAGVEHVGIALDYAFDTDGIEDVIGDHTNYWPKDEYPGGVIDFIPPEQLPEITEVMLRRGFSDAEVTGILGGNFMRVARQVWK